MIKENAFEKVVYIMAAIFFRFPQVKAKHFVLYSLFHCVNKKVQTADKNSL